MRVGEALDFWQVLDVAQEERLLLLAEMKVPGEVMLEFKIFPVANQYTDLEMLSRFFPKGLWGCFTSIVFIRFMKRFFFGMLRKIAEVVRKPIVVGLEQFKPRFHGSCALPIE